MEWSRSSRRRPTQRRCSIRWRFSQSDMADARPLPSWAEDLRRRYIRGEASIFILSGNVYDAVLGASGVVTLTDFLGKTLLKESKDTIAVYNVANGVRFLKRGKDVEKLDDLILSTEKPRILAAL